MCFFCEEKGSVKQPLHNVSTFSAGESLNEAINLSGNDVLGVKLSTSLDATDPHAIDIKYHKNCWLKNVTNVIKKALASDKCSSDLVIEAAARIEFLAMTETALREGKILTMSDQQSTFEEVWLIQGPKTDRLNKEKTEDVKKRAMSLCQTAISMCLTERQTSNNKSQTLRLTREMPQQLAVGLAVHQLTRSKELVNMLHGFGMAVEYNRLMRVEAQIEATVLKRMEENGGVYLPPDIVKGRHVFFCCG